MNVNAADHADPDDDDLIPRKRSVLKTTVAALLVLAMVVGVLGWFFVTGLHVIRHESIRIPTPDGEIAATISIPRWGSGPFPAVVCVHGSGPRRADDLRIVWRNLVPEGFVVLTYDKPGVGGSSGTFNEVRTDTSEAQLRRIAEDVLACRAVLTRHPSVDPSRVGLFGGSQAGWIIPLAGDIDRSVPFSVILSGPATSFGVEMEYSALTGEGRRPGAGLDDDSIDRRLDAFGGMAGYEPLPVLARATTPTLWLFGARDVDIPAARSARIVEGLRNGGAPFEVIVYPKGDHNLQDADTGRRLDYWTDVIAWLSKNVHG